MTKVEHPRIRAQYAPIVSDTGATFLLGEGRPIILEDPAYAAVIPLMDGQRTIADIASELTSVWSPVAVFGAITRLIKLGLVGEGCAGEDNGALAFWDALQTEPSDARRRLSDTTVEVMDLSEGGQSTMPGLLAAEGVRVVNATKVRGHGDLLVVVVDDYLDSRLQRINAECLEHEQPWLPVKEVGLLGWLGPIMEPGATGCWECMAQRIRTNRMVEQYLAQFGLIEAYPSVSRAALPSSRLVVASTAAREVVRYIVTPGKAPLRGQLLTLDQASGETVHHTLARQPQCPACGSPEVMNLDPKITLEGEPLRFDADGGFRSTTPEETFERLRHHISAQIGAVSWLEPVHSKDNGLSYSYSAGHNFAMVRNNLSILRKNLRGNSGGKGRTDVQARTSGICEAIERYSGVWSIDRPTTRARAAELDSRAVLPNDLMLFHDKQFETRKEWNALPTSRLHIVPEAFDTDRAVDWTAAWSLTREERVYVPSAYAWFGHPDSSDYFFTYSDGNGNASGNSLEEAILQGFCELVERDAVGIWWYNRVPRPGVDLQSFDEPYIEEILRYYKSMGRQLHVLDLTTDIGIPVFAAISWRVDNPQQDILMGFGAHPDPRLCVLRAITETNQFLPAVDGRDSQGNTIYMEEDVATLTWWKEARIEDRDWMMPSSATLTGADVHATGRLDRMDQYVRFGVDRAAAAGLEVLVVDQSRPDLELRVAKVMAPGIRHFWRRLAPGRLYDLPVKLGWLDRARTFEEMNPDSIFF